jgi:methylated-DNA-protein-cysteine methyltransferase-like protein
MSSRKPEIDLRIWQVIALIPTGKVASYGDIARHAGLPGAARRVGYALRHLPQDTKIPWHRVVNAQGRISLPTGSAGQYTQRARLEAEGVLFKGNKISQLGEFRWQPGDPGSIVRSPGN